MSTKPSPRITSVENIVKRKTAELIPYARNARKHSKGNVARIRRAIEEFGFLVPVVLDGEKGILAGHGRVLAARELNMEEVPTVDAAHLSDEQKKAFVLAENKLAESGEWDRDLLRLEILDLKGAGYDLDVAGFTKGDLDKLKIDQPAPGPSSPDGEDDKAPPVTQLGDLYILGEHRLLCGDSTKPEQVARLMGGRMASLVFTDPPYGVSYDSDKQGSIQNDDKRRDELLKIIKPAIANHVAYSTADAAFYIWHASSTRRDFEWAIDAVGLEEKQYITWIKDALVLGRADYHWQTEPCFYCQKQGQKASWFGGRDQTTVWRLERITQPDGSEIAIGNGLLLSDGAGNAMYIHAGEPKKKVRQVRVEATQSLRLALTQPATDAWEVRRDPRAEYIHPTQKPPDLALRAIRNHTREGEVVADFFAGSGSTLMACQIANRPCRTMELDPKFCDRIVKRWEKHTGSKAEVERE